MTHMITALLAPGVVIYVLGLAGLIPFAAASVSIALGGWSLPLDPAQAFASYSALILSFLAGALWGRSLGLSEPAQAAALLVVSNAVVLMAWAALLMGTALEITYLLLMAGFWLLMMIEYWLRDRLMPGLSALTPSSYLHLRWWLTNLVLLAHLTVLWTL